MLQRSLTRVAQRPGLLAAVQQSGLALALLALATYFSVSSSHFLTAGNLSVILQQVSVLAIVAIPGSMLVLAGYVDLSVGSVAGLAAIVFGDLYGHVPLTIAVAGGIAVGSVWGIANGCLVGYLGFSPIIVTLGGYAGAQGLASLIQHGNSIFGFSASFVYLGNGAPLGIPVPILVMLAAFLLGAFAWYGTPVGRHLKAIGTDRGAAYANGIAVRRLPMLLYVFSGTSAGLGGMILTAQVNSASIDIGVGLELQVLTAILLGGVAFTGGRGSLVGVALGLLFIGILTDGLILINAGPYFTNIAVGAALVIAAGLDAMNQRIERLPGPPDVEDPPDDPAVADSAAVALPSSA
jgi:ribose/xylose/arabinose/galactoside ABC-type transport system permease subunit